MTDLKLQDKLTFLVNKIENIDTTKFAYELEIRFKENITEFEFNRILKELLKAQQYEHITENDTVKLYENDIRCITSEETGIVSYQKKTVEDGMSFKSEVKSIEIKVCCSKEEQIESDSIPDKDPIIIRQKLRNTFIMKEKNFKIDLTKVTIEEVISYEIELEYLDLKKIKVKSIINDIDGISSKYLKYIAVFKKFKKAVNYHKHINYKNEQVKDTNYTKDFETRPTNITLDILRENKISFAVTNKLDGVGCYLYIIKYGDTNNRVVYRVENDKVTLEENIKIPNNIRIPCIIQTENYKNVFWVFDVICIENKSLFNEKFKKRQEELKIFYDKLTYETKKHIKLKKFYYNDLKIAVKNVFEFNKSEEEIGNKNDGIIFTPINETFKNDKTYKFKYSKYMTIDFLLKKTNIEHEYTLNIRVEDWFLDSIFNPVGVDKIVNKIRIEKNSEFYNKNLDNKIIECKYDTVTKEWSVYRERLDKNKPNFYTTAYSVFNDIINPITENDIINTIENYSEITQIKTNDIVMDFFKEYRSQHNSIKKTLISYYCKEKNVLDLGYGRGGDNHKYADNEIKRLYAVEPNIEFIKEAKSRLKQKKELHNKVYILYNKAQDTNQIRSQINNINKKNNFSANPNVIVSFFSLSFFFQSKKDLDQLIDTIDSNLNINDHFVGTTIDGELLYKYFVEKNTNILSVKNVFSIKRFDDSKIPEIPEIGNKIEANYDNTIVKNQTEYYVLWTLFVELLKSKNIILIESKIIEMNESIESIDPVLKNDLEKIIKLSSLYRTFVFKKVDKNIINNVKENNISSIQNMQDNKMNTTQLKELNTGKDSNMLDSIDFKKRELFDNFFIENNQFARIGVVGDGSCFFHAVLSAFSEFQSMNSEDIKKVVKYVRNKLSNELTFEKFSNLKTYIGFITIEIHKFLSENENKSDLRSVLIEILDYPNLTNHDQIQNIIIEKCSNNINIKDDCLDLFEKFKQYAFDKFKSKLRNSSTYVGLDVELNSNDGPTVNAIELLSKEIEHNIFIINGKTRIPYKIGEDVFYYNDKFPSIFITTVDDNKHYELVGRLERQQITTIFKSSSDPLVEKTIHIINGNENIELSLYEKYLKS